MLSKIEPVSGHCNVVGGRICYQIYNMAAEATPLIIIHGGPGTPHNYLQSLASLLPNRQVIFYDQLDCGLSDKPNQSELWQLERFVNEIEQLRQHLAIEKFHLFAHSAGTMFAFDYALLYAHRLETLILASPVLSIQRYSQTMQDLLSKFPEDIRVNFVSALEQQQTKTLEFMTGNAFFAEKHLCRSAFWPDELLDASIHTNTALRDHMWGKHDFTINGNLKDYERLDQLATFPVKTMITVGEYDFICPELCKFYAQSMVNAIVAVVKDASHNPHLEQPDVYAALLNEFLI